MKFSRGLNKVAVPPDSGAAIRLGEQSLSAGKEDSAGLVLVVFMRVLAGLWVIQGLLQWGAILLPSQSLLDNVSSVRGGTVIFFAIFDLVAAVGLWLAAPWGGVIWLLGAIAQILVTLGVPGSFSMFWAATNIILIVVYFVLTWRAGHATTAPGQVFRR
jgi:nicotinamide riboside transporter PnuC